MKTQVVEKIIYEGEEYCRVTEDDPRQCCNICIFSELCDLVLKNKISVENSPLELCSQSKYPYAYYIYAEDAFMYCQQMNY